MSIAAAKVVPLHQFAHVLAKLTGRNYKVRGRCVLSLAEVERKVTRNALMVWGAYAAYRDKDGSCWPSRERIVEVVKDFFGVDLTLSDVQVSLRRLRQVGLVRNIKWLPLKRYRKVYYRLIHGRVVLRGQEWLVGVPDKVAKQLSKASTRGGWRGGRPPLGGGDVTMSGILKNPDTLSHPTSCETLKSPLSSTPLPPLPPLPTSRCLATQDSDDRFAVEVDLKEEEAGAGVLSDLGFLSPDAPVYTGLQYVPGLHGIPRRPSEVLGRQAVVPGARPFTEEELADESRVVYRMRQAFEGAVRVVAGRKPSTYLRPVTAVTKLKLIELARRLTKIGASPEAWFLFSANRWGGKDMMPIGHALSERRLIEQSGWFRSVCRLYACTRTVVPSTERELSDRHSFMLALLWHRLPQTLEGVKAIVDRCFPGDLWDRMVNEARREITAEQASIDRKVADGEFVWVK